MAPRLEIGARPRSVLRRRISSQFKHDVAVGVVITQSGETAGKMVPMMNRAWRSFASSRRGRDEIKRTEGETMREGCSANEGWR
jgi:hypothetical protein